MHLQYEPLTEEQINRMGLIEPGIYRFKCVEARDTYSRAGAPQIEATLQIRLPDKSVQNMPAYLGTNGKFMMRMLRHFCQATNLMKEFESKNLSSSVIKGCEGLVKIDIQKGRPREDDPTKTYEDQNKIVDFQSLVDSANDGMGMKPLPKVANDFDDKDIGF